MTNPNGNRRRNGGGRGNAPPNQSNSGGGGHTPDNRRRRNGHGNRNGRNTSDTTTVTPGASVRIPGMPILRYGPNNNFDECQTEWKTHFTTKYGMLGQLTKDDEYYVPPAINAGEAFDEDEFEENPYLRIQIVEEVKSRQAMIMEMFKNRPKMFAEMWGHMSEESKDKVRQHPNWHLIQKEDDPLELWKAIKATHIVTAIGNPVADRATARDNYSKVKQHPTESLARYKVRFDNAVRARVALEDPHLPSEEDQAMDFINRLDDARYARFRANMRNSVNVDKTGTYPATLLEAYNRAANYVEVRTVPSGNGNGETVFVASADTVVRTKNNNNNNGNKKAEKGSNNNNNGVNNNNQQTSITSSTSTSTSTRKNKDECFLCRAKHRIYECPLIGTAVNLLQQQGFVNNQEHAHVTTADETNHRVSFADQEFAAYTTMASECTAVPTTPPASREEGVSVAADDIASSEEGDSVAVTDNTALVAHGQKNALGAYDVLLDNQASKSVFHQAELLVNIRSVSTVTVFKGVGGKIETNQVGNLPYVGEVSYAPQSIANVLALGEVEDKYQINYDQGKSFTVIINDDLHLTFWKRSNGLYVCNMRFVADMIARDASHNVMVHTVSEREALYTKRQVEDAKLARKFMREMSYSSVADLVQLVKSGMANVPITIHDLYRAERIYGPDVGSLKGKLKARPSPIVTVEHVPRPIINELTLHVDIMFIENIPYLISVSTPLGLTLVSCMDNRGATVVRKMLNDMLKIYRSREFFVKTLLSDGEGAIAKLSSELNAAGIAVNLASAGKHVPVVENKIKQVKERVRATLHDLPYDLPHVLMKYLVYFCVNRLNLLPSHLRMDSIAPTEAITGRKIDYKIHVRGSFGDYCQIEMPNVVKNSMEARTLGAILLYPVGNVQGSYHFCVLATAAVVTRDRWVTLPIPQEVINHMNKLAANDKHEITKDPVFRLNDRIVEIGKEEIFEDPEAAYGEGDVPTKYTDGVVQDVADVLPDLRGTTTVVAVDTPVAATGAPVVAVDAAPPPLVPTHSYNTRYQVRLSSTTVATTLHYDDEREEDRIELQFHITVDQALHRFPDQAADALVKELGQMALKGVFKPVHVSSLSPDEKKGIIISFMFYKEKFLPDGSFDKLKARLVAGGHMQDRAVVGDISSPTVSLSAVMMVAAIAKKENRKVVTVDIAGAYLNASMEGRRVFMRLDKVMAGVMVHIDPSYKQYLRDDGTVVVKLEKALYGCIESAKLWYEKLEETLKDFGMTANPREPCVFNKPTKSGCQITAIIYVDDLMITCAVEEEIVSLCNYLKDKFETITMNEGVKHSYLGMSFDFGNDDGLVVTMPGYEDDVIRTFNVVGVAATPATNSLFNVDDSSPPLDRARSSVLFHSKVAKLLYLALRSRPDILTAISFLTTRVKGPTEEDDKKLDRVLRYLKGSRGKGIVIKAEDGLVVKAYVDASYGVHADMKSHTGCVITLGKGPIFVRSAKQKLVSKSSTEAELIALSDSAGQVIWTREFLTFQGYDIGPAVIYQDNMSTIALVNKGRSHAPGSRHINIRYFFIKDRIDTGELVVEHLSTLEMISDFSKVVPLKKEKD